ncbi:AMP-binding protein [Ureibacillus sinduriensis]|uniref:Phosphatase n=1 Tax=Ureibacillus sinduriensis BLB-1 = JCM 15800 TaxID=1384057 RepID=A0A0A3HV49_9BACL|nr:AMP-binding protein [Ureibacillus sinduriensis]KGR76476.1 phosphatase [Ureibacillus sinduriensis BLB-1 = JCM 15800]
MSFHNIAVSDKTAVITEGKQYTYRELNEMGLQFNFLNDDKKLVLLLCKNTIETLSAYLSALNNHHAVMLMSADTNAELLNSIVNEYKPYWIIGTDLFDGYRQEGLIQERVSASNIAIHKDLAILLSTSGTTGSQKFVRLSYENIQSNAEAIVEYLNIDGNERAIMNLPMSYSYGLSIINSHLQAKASILLTEESVMSKTFWQFVQEQQATSLAGVPFTYQMLHRLGFLKMDLPHLKTLTQAGGRLNEKLVKVFAQYAKEQDKKFFVMYGQTEASPRISYIPSDRVLEKAGTIGIAIPGGELSVDPETGELIYKGSNVMMGYARCLEDLEKGDELNGILHTGDTATIDQDNYFIITGRMKRIIKLFGLRINLDEVEKKLESEVQASVACTGNDDKLVIAIENDQHITNVQTSVEQYYKLHKSAYKVIVIDLIPRFANGKIDYVTLKEQCL